MHYANTNRGQMWPNEGKEKDTHPDFKGSLNIKGEEFWISAWRQNGGADSEAPGLLFSVQPKSETAKEPPKDYVVLTDDLSEARD